MLIDIVISDGKKPKAKTLEDGRTIGFRRYQGTSSEPLPGFGFGVEFGPR